MAKGKNVVLLTSVIVVREGKRVAPPIGKAFPLTDEEIEALRENIDYRAAVNEDAEADEADVKALTSSPGREKPKTNAKGAGNTTTMADGMDGTSTTEDEKGQTSDSNEAGKTEVPKAGKAAKAADTPPVDDDL